MKRINKKRILSFILSFALLFSTFSICITVNAIEDTASNSFANWSDSIAADGTLQDVVKGTAFTANSDVWAAEKKIYEVNFGLAATMSGDNAKYLHIIYSYTDANNYKALEVRETSSYNLYMSFVDVVAGVRTKPTDMTATNSISFQTAANKDTKVPVGFIQGANVNVRYIDSSNIKFTFTSADGTQSFETQLTASDAANLDFKSTSIKFGFFLTSKITDAKFSKISIEFEKDTNDYIADFQEKYADVLVDNSNPEDLETVKLAVAEYNEETDAVKAGLEAEYAQLKKNFAAMIIAQGSYSTDFETTTEFWEQYADYTDKYGVAVVQDDFAIEDITGKTGGISQSESGKILVGNTTVTTETYTQSDNSNENINAINATMMLSPSRDIWSGAKESNMNFAQAEFDLWVNLSGSSSGVMIYYNYVDNNNFSYFRILRSTNNRAGVYNMVIGEDETTGLRTRTYNGSAQYAQFNNWATDANNWLRVKIAYTTDGNAVLYLTGDPEDDVFSFVSNDVIEEENRMFAIGVSAGASTEATLAMDNFYMLFTDEESQQGIAFEQQYFETLSLNTERFAAYDVAEVDRMLSAYDTLPDSAKQVLSSETQSAITELETTRNLWDTTSDETVAESYKNIWNSKLTTETEKAWNVYNRLTAAQKALLTEEYDAMVSAMQEKTQVTDDTVNINCVGDSITNGNGSTEAATYSYPAQMQTILGEGYTISRNGIAGIRVVEDYTITSADDVELNMDGSTAWENSHMGEDDIIIIQLGTNDLAYVAGKEQIKADIYKAGLEKLIQSYLKLENSPFIILSNTPVSYSAMDKGFAYKTIALINMEMAEKYGLPCVDMQAFTEAYTDEEVGTYYGTDRLHPSDAGYTKMAEVFANAINSLETTFDTADVSAYTFDDNSLNNFLAPEMLAATIKKANSTKAQHLGFRTKNSAAVKTGTEIVEYGTIFAKYKSDSEAEILSKMVYSETEDETKTVVYARGYETDIAGYEYIAGIACATTDAVKEAYITRAYVKYSDGTVYYSINDYKDATSYSERKGVINGFASRSVVSVAKEMVRYLAINDITDNTVATYDAETDVLTFSEAAKSDYDVVFNFLTNNAEIS